MERHGNGSQRPGRIVAAHSQTLTRRHVVGGGLGAAGAAAIGAGLTRPGGALAKLTGLAAAQDSPVALPEIPELSSVNGLLTLDLIARSNPSRGQDAYGYALCDDPDNPDSPDCMPMSPGPTLRLRRRDRLKLHLVNTLGEATNLHVHGLHVSPRATSDNIFVHVHDGGHFDYEYQIPENHRSGIFWYHPHFHGRSRNQVNKGLAGAIIIDEHADDPAAFRYEPPEAKGVPERLLVLQRLAPLEDRVQINGALSPEIQFVPDTWERWRILNASSHTFVNLFLDGVDFYRIAVDGNWLEEATEAPVVPIGPAERAEVLVKLGSQPSYQLSTLSTLASESLNGLRKPIFNRAMATTVESLATLTPQVTAIAAAMQAAEPPTMLLPLRDLRGSAVPQRQIRLQFDPPPPPPPVGFKIDAKAFNPGRVDQTVELDGVEQWTIKSETDDAGWHPLHIHVNDFQVLAIKLAAPDPILDPLLKKLLDPVFFSDTVPVPPLGHVEIRAEFLEFAGRFVYHCHFLDHEDNGMMGVIDVVQPVRIADGALTPETVDVHAGPNVCALVNSGTTVVWTNRGAKGQTITADAVDFFTGQPIFTSGSLGHGQSFAHTFDAPGTMTYRGTSQNHADVTGTVVVAAAQTVDIRDFAFQPDPVMVAVGTTVTWTNRDADPHSATADAEDAAGEPVFDTGQLAQGDTGSYTFAAIGDFSYHCANHPGMRGTIAVRPVMRQSVSIGIFDEGLERTPLEVFADSTVTWTNRGKGPVSVAVSGTEPSGVLDPEQLYEPGKALLLGQRFSQTFETAGDVSYQVEAATEPVTTFEGSVKVIQPVAIVDFSKFAFEPAQIAVQVGAEVIWLNRDSTAHTATAKDLDPGTGKPLFDTGTIEPGAFHRLKIDTAGTFAYRCTAHPEHAESEGTITVMESMS